jgi:hypothetical protein
MDTYPDAIRTNNEVCDDCSTVRESDCSGVIVDALATGMGVITFDTAYGGRKLSHVIYHELARGAFTFLRGRSVKETSVYILTVYHVMVATPGGFVVAQVLLVGYTASLPVTSNVLLKEKGFRH